MESNLTSKNRKEGFIKGTIVGIFHIIPGISGGTLAAVFGIYKRMIESIDLLFKSPLKAVKNGYDIFVGIISGLLGSFFIFSYGYDAFPLAITLFFMGMLLGGIRPVLNYLKGNFKISNILIALLFFLIIFSMSFWPVGEFKSNSFYLLVLFFAGFISAIVGFAPGISGSLLLMVLGYYGHILSLGKEIFDGILAFNFIPLKTNFFPLLVLLLGMIIGFIISIKLVKFLLKKYETKFYFAVFGMVTASPITILLHLNNEFGLKTFKITEWAVGIVLAFFGVILALKVVDDNAN